ncbi:DUF5994 family protein [Nonomuraea bangladeshensis]|uniref:DUF5994 family protein n=1 Tax=Nonomuraea bangladeshensis TaxID=404385 RepID=A0ABV3GZA4_9ACTN
MMTTLLPPSSPVLPNQSALRLSLNAVLDRRGTVDGAWWPRTRDAAAELPALISAVDQRLDRAVLRVGLHIDAWDHIPRRIPARGRQVRVGWFRSAEPNLITLSIAGAAPITLLVIPPSTATGPAMAALALAAAGTVGVRPADILHPTDLEEGSVAGTAQPPA